LWLFWKMVATIKNLRWAKHTTCLTEPPEAATLSFASIG
jgi:hypothetical protein